MWKTSSRRISSKISRVWIVVHELPVDREAAGGGLLRDVQERQQAMVGLVLDGQIVQPVPAGQRRAVEERLQARRTGAEERGTSLAEEIAVMQFVDGMLEIQPAQQRIRRQLGGPEDVATAVGLDFPEREQLAHAPVEVAPHPAVDGPQQPIERCDTCRRSHRATPGEGETSIPL